METRFISPPITGSEVAIRLLVELEKFLTAERTVVADYFNVMCSCDRDGHGKNTGIRTINGRRYEIFVEATGLGDHCFRWMIRQAKTLHKGFGECADHMSTEEVKNEIINYATERAKLDPRTDGHRFENFGFILTYGKVGAQEVHIDLANKEHLQCALIASSGNYATSEYVCTDEPVVTTAQCLTRIWQTPMPVSLIEKIGSNEASVLLLKTFGSLLGQCRKRNKDGKRSGKTEIGTVTTCPGTVPHCGPVSTNMRMVLFFTSTPKDAVKSYDVNTQYTKLGVCADLVTENWTQFNGDERMYVLSRFSEALTQKLVKNIQHTHLEKIAKALISCKGKNKKAALMRAVANDKKWLDNSHWYNAEYIYKLPVPV